MINVSLPWRYKMFVLYNVYTVYIHTVYNVYTVGTNAVFPSALWRFTVINLAPWVIMRTKQGVRKPDGWKAWLGCWWGVTSWIADFNKMSCYIQQGLADLHPLEPTENFALNIQGQNYPSPHTHPQYLGRADDTEPSLWVFQDWPPTSL
jgi:hypothetical protein